MPKAGKKVERKKKADRNAPAAREHTINLHKRLHNITFIY
jgi:hypothetical protein